MRTTTIITICIFAFIFGSGRASATTEQNRAEIRSFLVKHSVFHDISKRSQKQQEEIDHLNSFVRKVFEREYTDCQIPDLITQALQLFFDNSIGEFVDAPDVARWTIRRGMTLMALAFLADDWRHTAFLNDARITLREINDSRRLLMVNLIEIYKGLEFWGFTTVRQISRFQEILNSKQAYISENFFDEYNQILLNIKANAR